MERIEKLKVLFLIKKIEVLDLIDLEICVFFVEYWLSKIRGFCDK